MAKLQSHHKDLPFGRCLTPIVEYVKKQEALGLGVSDVKNVVKNFHHSQEIKNMNVGPCTSEFERTEHLMKTVFTQSGHWIHSGGSQLQVTISG